MNNIIAFNINNSTETLFTMKKVDSFINEYLANVDSDKALTDITVVKSFVKTILSNERDQDQSIVLILKILRGYTRNFDLSKASTEVKGYLITLGLKVLDNINYGKALSTTTNRDLFMLMLTRYFSSCNEFQACRLKESFLRFKTAYNDYKVSTFQVFTVNQLFKNRMFYSICEIVGQFHVDEYDMAEEKCLNLQYPLYMHQVSHSLIIDGSYEQASKLLSIILSLSFLTFERVTFDCISIEYMLLSMILNRSSNYDFIPLLKLREKIPTKIVDVFQSFHSYDLESFVYNYLLCIHEVGSNSSTSHLLDVFTTSRMIELSKLLLDNRYLHLSTKLSKSRLRTQELYTNDLIRTLNSKISRYSIQLPNYSFNPMIKATGAKSIQPLKYIDDLAHANRDLKHMNS